MANVRVDSGELPSMKDCADRHEMGRVLGKWQSIAQRRFRHDCQSILQMIDETDELRLWEKNIDGFTFNNRDEFLQEHVLIDYEITAEDIHDIASRLRLGEKVKLNLRKELHGKLYGEGKSLREIANVTGTSHMTVKRDVKCNTCNPRIVYQLSAGTNPQTAARKIREKFGNEYADNLMDALHSH